jgi:cytochrome oxidase Cu insertion factor (SCO1/SenC/PrrC family)
MSRCALWVSGILVFAAAETLAQEPRPRQGDLRVGEAAPDFAVQDVDGKTTIKLSQLKGRPTLLIFGSCT